MSLDQETTTLSRVVLYTLIVALLGALGCSSPTPEPPPTPTPKALAEPAVVEQPARVEPARVEPTKVEPAEEPKSPPPLEAGPTVTLEVTPCPEKSSGGEVPASMAYDASTSKLDLYDGVGHRYTLDLATDKVSASKGDNPARPWPRLEVGKKGAKVCRGEVCKTLVLPKGASTNYVVGTLSSDATSGALLYHLESNPEDRPQLAIYAGSKWKKPKKIMGLGDELGDNICANDVRWLSDGLVAATLDVCAGPGGTMFIYDAKSGAMVATTSLVEDKREGVAIPAANYNMYGAKPVALGGERWLLYDSVGSGMIVFDAKKRTFGEPVSWAPRELAFDPGDVMVEAGPKPGQVMVSGRSSFGDVYVFDVAAGKEVKRYVMCRGE